MTNTPEKWVLGIDPGYGNTGAVFRLAAEREVVAASCWLNDDTHDWDVSRSLSIAVPLIEQAVAWVQDYDVRQLEVCIEHPVYTGNAKVLMMQMHLFVLLQAYVYDYLVPLVDEVYLTIVNPKTSKSKLCHNGNAKKPEMIKASPWHDESDLNFEQKHTLADAYAHSLSAHTEQWALHNIQLYSMEPNVDITYFGPDPDGTERVE